MDVTKQEQLKKVMDFIDNIGLVEEARPKKPVAPSRNLGTKNDEEVDAEPGNEMGDEENNDTQSKKGRRGVDISKNTWKDLVKFKILFSASFRAYGIMEGFDSILGINTKNSERLFDFTSSSPLMKSSIIISLCLLFTIIGNVLTSIA